MKIHVFSSGKTALLELEGHISHETSYRLYYNLAELLSAGCRHLVLSLAQAEMVTSTAIRYFIEMKDRLASADGDLTLCYASKELQFALKAMKLESFFHLAATVDDALSPYHLKKSELQPGLPKEAEPVSAAHAALSETAALRLSDVMSGIEAMEEAEGTEESEVGAVEDEALFASQSLSDERIDHLVNHLFPNRLTVSILDWYVTHNHSFGEVDPIAEALRADAKAVKAGVKVLCAGHVLKKMGGGIYNFAPEETLREELSAFLRLWHCPDGHSALLARVLKREMC